MDKTRHLKASPWNMRWTYVPVFWRFEGEAINWLSEEINDGFTDNNSDSKNNWEHKTGKDAVPLSAFMPHSVHLLAEAAEKNEEDWKQLDSTPFEASRPETLLCLCTADQKEGNDSTAFSTDTMHPYTFIHYL